ncbi:hypothetical protein ABT330_35460 [Streptomyces sp. NPDC000658]|uniref:hypothetical protein n=1 Tax=Streptomyces sp. NPDC000658 TaxID=3154266 RepID=UPI003333634D
MDRESAFEKLAARAETGTGTGAGAGVAVAVAGGRAERAERAGTLGRGTQIGREITRSLFGTARRRR